MFGYVMPRMEDLTQEERERYHAAYCGVCRALGERFGQRCRVALTYDMTFLALLLGVCLRTLTAALQSRDALGRNICVGIFAALFLQTVINLGMNLQVLPVIGVTLPFFSAGGSSVVMMYLCVGLVLSVGLQARRSRVDAVAIL